MEPFNTTELGEQISIYENKVKVIKEKIRNELQIRRDLKAKIEEAKRGESAQLMYLERLDACERVVSREMELTEKQEDSESSKQLITIQKYETMLQNQQKTWAKYEERYEQLPLAVEKQKTKTLLLKVQIEEKLIDYKIETAKRLLRVKEQIDKRREQLRIIEFAKLYTEHKKRDTLCSDLINRMKNLKIKERELNLEIQSTKRQIDEMEKLESSMKKTSIKAQQLPEVDLSHFIIQRDKDDYLDTISVNTYILEQEYMNNDDPTLEKIDDTLNSENSQENNPSEDTVMEVDNNDDMQRMQNNQSRDALTTENVQQMNEKDRPVNMETQINPFTKLQASQKLSMERVNDYNRRMNNFNSNINSNKNTSNNEDQAYASRSVAPTNTQKSEKSQNNRNNYEQDKRMNLNSKVEKNNSQESQQESDNKNHSKKRASQQSNKDDSPGSHLPKDESGSTPAKMMKHSQQTQHQPSKGNPDKGNTIDLSKLPQSNKPQIKSIERVNYDMSFQAGRKEIPANTHAAQSSASSMQTPANVGASKPPATPWPSKKTDNTFEEKNFHQTKGQQDLDVTPMSVEMPPSIDSASLMSPLLDPNMYGGDAISAILGSEITEPGGSFELARRIYGDSDLNSDDEFDYEKMMGQFSSPVGSPKFPQQSKNLNNQAPSTSNNEVPPKSSSQEKNDANFNFIQFGKKQPNKGKLLF